MHRDINKRYTYFIFIKAWIKHLKKEIHFSKNTNTSKIVKEHKQRRWSFTSATNN